MKTNHLLALLPLFAILSISPAQLEQKVGRSIASEPVSEVKSLTPKYDARAEKVDKTKLEKDEALDMTKFSTKADAFRAKLQKERKEYLIDLCEKEAVAEQKKRVEDLVLGLVELEEDSKFVKEKGLLTPEGKEIHDKSMSELKVTLESILQDEVEHELLVAQERMRELEQKQKELEEKEKEKEQEVVKEEPPKKTKEEQLICDLEEKNKVLTKQVEDLMKEQQKILQTMVGMNQMMIQMSQQMQQQQPQIPSWMMAGSLVNPQLQYPGQFPMYLPQPQTIVINNAPSDLFGQQPVMGQQMYQQGAFSPQFQQPQFQAPMFQQDPGMFQQQHIPGNFGMSPYSFNFGGGIGQGFGQSFSA